jgi:hypothetical protein
MPLSLPRGPTISTPGAGSRNRSPSRLWNGEQDCVCSTDCTAGSNVARSLVSQWVSGSTATSTSACCDRSRVGDGLVCCPLAVATLQDGYAGEPERLPDSLEQAGQRDRSAQHGAGERGEQCGTDDLPAGVAILHHPRSTASGTRPTPTPLCVQDTRKILKAAGIDPAPQRSGPTRQQVLSAPKSSGQSRADRQDCGGPEVQRRGRR